MTKELLDKIRRSREILRLAAAMSREYYRRPLAVMYSGGKDSEALLHLAATTLGPDGMEAVHSHTTVDAPQTVYHVRETFSSLERAGIKTDVIHPVYKGKRVTMWDLIVLKKMPPTRTVRYCCGILKESSLLGRYIATGVRSSESVKRKDRNDFALKRNGKYLYFGYEHVGEVYYESHHMDSIWDCSFITAAKQNRTLSCSPLLEWTDDDIWSYIHSNGLRCNPLYEMGYRRVGCIGCPLAGRRTQLKEFRDFPTYRRAYIRAFQKLVEARKETYPLRPYRAWRTGDDVFSWWVGNPAA